MATLVTALDGRIRALTITHELLSQRSWQGISVVDLVRQELAPYATTSNTEIIGSDRILSADAGQVIGMVVHELATNAAKYGALSNKAGRVLVYCRRQQNELDENNLRIDWPERGGPRVIPQSKCGYGTSVIRDLMPYELGALSSLHTVGTECTAFWNFPLTGPSIATQSLRPLGRPRRSGVEQFPTSFRHVRICTGGCAATSTRSL